jgi:hypothetical protein
VVEETADEVLEEPGESFVEEEVPAEEEVQDEEDEDIDDLSNWNVPSWAELIASLYRPER